MILVFLDKMILAIKGLAGAQFKERSFWLVNILIILLYSLLGIHVL